MEFEQYLERDILTFLDSKIDKKENTSIDREEEYGLYLTRDYLKELNYALDNDELTRAKKLFDELKANYSRLPKSSVERKKIYSLLEKMYDKIQNYVRIKEGKIEVIKQGNSEIFKDTTEKFTTLADRMQKESITETSDNTKSSLIKREDLLIGSAIIKPVEIIKEKPSEDEVLGKKKHSGKNVAVEANISGNSLKDQFEKPTIKNKSDKKNQFETSENEDISSKEKFENYTSEERKNWNDQTEYSSWDNEIIDTALHLEKLKMRVTNKLLDDLRRKISEQTDEQNKKIESLRQDIVTQVIEELDKRLHREKSEVSSQIESLRGEILDKVYHQAQHIVSSKDIDNNTKDIYINYAKDVKPEQKNSNTTKSIDDVEPYNSKNSDASLNTFEDEVKTKQISVNKYSGEELRVVYEQAIYYMFDNKYNEAAKLFKKIIAIQPKNKAAHIRLQECIEKQPELFKNNETIPDIEFKTTIQIPKKGSENADDEITHNTNIDLYDDFTDTEKNSTSDYSDYKDEAAVPIDTFAEDIQKLQKYGIRHKYNDDELQNMYEEAIYTMFQNNFNEAARIFEEILRIRPQNKAARIRLQECKEATNNA